MIQIQDIQLRALLDQFQVKAVAANSVLANVSADEDLRRGWTLALGRAIQRRLDGTMMTWVTVGLQQLASKIASDETKAFAAEVDAGLRLAWLDSVRPPTTGRGPTCDFRVGALNIEVFCPQEHVEERAVTQAGLAAQANCADGTAKVAIVVSHPITGSDRKVDADDCVVPNPRTRALRFPTNKVMDRILSEKKRKGTQFVRGESNILWLDLKHGWQFSTVHCLPLRSLISKGTCFVGMNGVWQAFYGRKGDPLFIERTALEYPVRDATYEQQREGWFRELHEVSSVVISVLDGVIRFDNPWASTALVRGTSELLMSLGEWRPEFSWFDEEMPVLENRVEAERRRIVALAQPKHTRR